MEQDPIDAALAKLAGDLKSAYAIQREAAARVKTAAAELASIEKNAREGLEEVRLKFEPYVLASHTAHGAALIAVNEADAAVESAQGALTAYVVGPAGA